MCEAVAASGISEGQASAFVRGSTAAITTMEYEPGGVHDLQALLERLIPPRGDHDHNRLNHDIVCRAAAVLNAVIAWARALGDMP